MATQKGRNWSSGDIVTAANLSSIERGVSEVAEEYIPTTWANGNTVTAAGLNNIEQGIANAGGSGDFSIAQVTLTVTVQEGVSGAIGMISASTPCIVEGHIDAAIGFGVGTETLAIVMYGNSGTPLLFFENQMGTYIAEEPVATGDITYDEEKGCYMVTGDGTISIVLTNN